MITLNCFTVCTYLQSDGLGIRWIRLNVYRKRIKTESCDSLAFHLLGPWPRCSSYILMSCLSDCEHLLRTLHTTLRLTYTISERFDLDEGCMQSVYLTLTYFIKRTLESFPQLKAFFKLQKSMSNYYLGNSIRNGKSEDHLFTYSLIFFFPEGVPGIFSLSLPEWKDYKPEETLCFSLKHGGKLCLT